MKMIRFAKAPTVFGVIVLFLLANHVIASAQTAAQRSRSRIQGNIDDQDRTSLAGTVYPATKALLDLGRVPSDTPLRRVTIVFKRSQQQQQDLDALLQQQQDPTSPNFHKWLTPSQFQSRFGISDSDLAAVKSWLQAKGLQVIEESSDRSMVVFSGPAAAVEQAFNTEFHSYSANGETHFANASELSLPSALAGVAAGVRGLNDFRPRPRPHLKRAFTSSISGSHFLAPDDFATIYNLKALYAAGIDGTGQKIAIVGQSDIVPVAISTFRSVSGLPASNPQVILIPGSADPGVASGDVDEASLDIEWSGAVAPGASIIYVNSKNALDSLQYAIQNNVAPVISSSYGDCEPNFSQTEITADNSLLQQANVQGQTIVGASGDSGAADCDYPTTSTPVTTAKHGLAVDFPPSSPFVTAVGGSTFSDADFTFWNATNNANNGSVLSYLPEITWNDTTSEIANGGSLAASGGGVSVRFSKPSWQAGAGVPADGARDLPDITFAASSDHDGYLICSKGTSNTTTGCVNGYRNTDTTLTVVGGTSVGAPTFAGVVALINQKSGAQGNINPKLYTLASGSGDVFRDITTGDNKVPCTSGTTDCTTGGSIGYSAGVGYDLATGLGSPNVANLVNEMLGTQSAGAFPDFQLSPASSNLTVNAGSTVSDNISINPLNGFSSSVIFSCTMSSALKSSVCAVTPSSLTGGGSASLTITASAIAAAAPSHDSFPGTPLWAFGTLGVCAFVFAGKRSHKGILAIALVAAIGIVGVGCGGGGSSTTSSATAAPTPNTRTPVVGSVTVTGTSNTAVRSVQIAVTVN